MLAGVFFPLRSDDTYHLRCHSSAISSPVARGCSLWRMKFLFSVFPLPASCLTDRSTSVCSHDTPRSHYSLTSAFFRTQISFPVFTHTDTADFCHSSPQRPPASLQTKWCANVRMCLDPPHSSYFFFILLPPCTRRAALMPMEHVYV